MTPQFFTIAGSVIIILLGGAHLWLTFNSDKFHTKDPAVMEGMKNTHPLLTRRLSVWSAWIGFNGSHSLGAIFYGLINVVLIAVYGTLLDQSVAIYVLNVVCIVSYLLLGLKYWFRKPNTGIAIATACFIIALMLHQAGRQ